MVAKCATVHQFVWVLYASDRDRIDIYSNAKCAHVTHELQQVSYIYKFNKLCVSFFLRLFLLTLFFGFDFCCFMCALAFYAEMLAGTTQQQQQQQNGM